ncbi:MAG: aspartate aminotransferase family protein [Hyphomicrobiales bacterium]|nr:aspartate aminotransferase family protein [Hyphomicrobiales bacterium]
MNGPLLPVYPRASGLSFRSGKGVILTDGNGRDFLDFAAGIAVNILGYAHPHMLERMREAIERPWHLSNLYVIPGQTRLAERLLERAPFAETVFFTNSGAEALECALKTVRRHHFAQGNTQRSELITFEGAFHGRTLATTAAGGRAKYLEGIGEPLSGFRSLPFGDVEAVAAAVGEKTAGVLLEPVQGEGGVRAWPAESLARLRALCDAHGLLLVFDEVQCGMGRTGDFFGYEFSGIHPDIVALAKGLGGGFPVGACIASGRASSGMDFGIHGSTFGGNPLAMSAGDAVLDVVLEDGFLEHVKETSAYFRQGLEKQRASHPGIIEELRGRGLMVGLRCAVAKEKLIAALLEQRLLCVGADDNVVRLLPPLVVERGHIDTALEAIDNACLKLEGGS